MHVDIHTDRYLSGHNGDDSKIGDGMSELRKNIGKAEANMRRIRHVERKAIKIQGDLASLYTVEHDTG
jgi:putative component of toxin-antitoxin plasmid stabilization module